MLIGGLPPALKWRKIETISRCASPRSAVTRRRSMCFLGPWRSSVPVPRQRRGHATTLQLKIDIVLQFNLEIELGASYRGG